jgi:hypothetical protein
VKDKLSVRLEICQAQYLEALLASVVSFPRVGGVENVRPSCAPFSLDLVPFSFAMALLDGIQFARNTTWSGLASST